MNEEDDKQGLLSRMFGAGRDAWRGVRGNIATELGASLVPGVGTAMDIEDLATGVSESDYAKAALAALGLALPVSGPAIKSGAKAAKSFLFDRDAIGRAIDFGRSNAPDVVGQRIERLVPPRGVPEQIRRAGDESNIRRLVDIANRGIDAGGHLWYDLDPVKSRFVEAAGEEGRENFRRLTDLLAATSPRSRVNENIRRATYFNKLLSDARRAGEAIGAPSKGEIPAPFGHLAHGSQSQMLDEIFDTGSFSNPIERPKATSFSQNLYGNLEPVTVDTHNLRSVLGGDVPVERGVRKNEYGALEDINRAVADKLGIKPAAAQSAIWVGDAAKTGVANPDNFVEIMDDMARYTADQMGISASELLKRLAEGRSPLLFQGK